MPSSERAQRLAELVKAAVECGPGQWDTFLDEECKSDPAMRAEIDSLLKHQKHVDQFIEPNALNLAAASFLHEGADRAGQMIEDYQVLSRIGIGGMGEVYLAQDTKLRRKVALKLVRAGMDTSEILARFRQEEQILASLNHPNIAQLYGAGMARGDVPFLVMEYIEGERIDVYSKEKAHSTTARLELFRKVCSAVLYAHQRLIIHRDLKPSNILVTADGEPKLLDFGIAKLLEGQDAFTQMQPTLAGVMTPDYASPEQVRGEQMTTATDVYSLGVLLYELLTGQRPYRLKTRSPDEIARAITDQEPERPSAAIARSDGNPKNQDSNPKQLRGDLDNIVLMALRKEPSRRYSSVGQFSDDVRRYLDGLPVLAHKDTLSYRATKFIQRNKIGVVAAILIVLTLLGGIVATTWQASRARRQALLAAEERDRARKQATKADRLNAFLQNILGFSDPTWLSPNPQQKREATIADALQQAGKRAPTELADQPDVLATVHFTIGWTSKVLGQLDAAGPHLRRSLELRRELLAPSHQEIAQSLVGLGGLFLFAGKFAEAEPVLGEAIEIFRAAERSGGVDRKWFAVALNELGVAHQNLGKVSSAEALFQEALSVGRDFVGVERVALAVMRGNLGLLARDKGDLDGAQSYLEEAVREHRSISGEARSDLGPPLHNLATVLTIKREYDLAELIAHEALSVFQNTVGEKHPYTARPYLTLSNIEYYRGDYRKARELAERALQLQLNSLPEGQVDFSFSWLMLGKVLVRLGELGESEAHLRRALELRSRIFGLEHRLTAEVQAALGESLGAQNRHEEAEPFLVSAVDTMQTRFGAGDPRTVEAAQQLAAVRAKQGDRAAGR